MNQNEKLGYLIHDLSSAQSLGMVLVSAKSIFLERIEKTKDVVVDIAKKSPALVDIYQLKNKKQKEEMIDDLWKRWIDQKKDEITAAFDWIKAEKNPAQRHQMVVNLAKQLMDEIKPVLMINDWVREMDEEDPEEEPEEDPEEPEKEEGYFSRMTKSLVAVAGASLVSKMTKGSLTSGMTKAAMTAYGLHRFNKGETNNIAGRNSPLQTMKNVLGMGGKRSAPKASRSSEPRQSSSSSDYTPREEQIEGEKKQGKILELLEQIEENTRGGAGEGPAAPKAGGIMGVLASVGAALLKFKGELLGLGATLASLAAGKMILGGGRGAGGGTRTPGNTGSTGGGAGTSRLDKIKNAFKKPQASTIKPNPNRAPPKVPTSAGGMSKGVMARFAPGVGTALALADAGVDVYDAANDDTLTSDEKNVRYAGAAGDLGGGLAGSAAALAVAAPYLGALAASGVGAPIAGAATLAVGILGFMGGRKVGGSVAREGMKSYQGSKKANSIVDKTLQDQDFGNVTRAAEGSVKANYTGKDLKKRAYGKYQFNTGEGGLRPYLDYIKKHNPKIYDKLRKFDPGLEIIPSKEFDNAWIALGEGPLAAEFDKSQDDAWKEVYAKPAIKMGKAAGFAVENRAVAELLASNFTHGGHKGFKQTLKNALEKISDSGKRVEDLSAEEQVEVLLKSKTDFMKKVAPGRASDERAAIDRHQLIAKNTFSDPTSVTMVSSTNLNAPGAAMITVGPPAAPAAPQFSDAASRLNSFLGVSPKKIAAQTAASVQSVPKPQVSAALKVDAPKVVEAAVAPNVAVAPTTINHISNSYGKATPRIDQGNSLTKIQDRYRLVGS